MLSHMVLRVLLLDLRTIRMRRPQTHTTTNISSSRKLEAPTVSVCVCGSVEVYVYLCALLFAHFELSFAPSRSPYRRIFN